jgi:site-specific recombinase XerD
MIRVTGKGNKTRLVPVGSKAREAISYYLEMAGQNLCQNTAAPKSAIASRPSGRRAGLRHHLE